MTSFRLAAPFAFLMILAFVPSSPVLSHASPGNDEAQWTKISEADGITVYRKETSGSEVVSLRGETIIPAKPSDVFAIMKDNSISKDWVPMVVEKRDIEQISPTKRLEYTHIDLPWPLTDRYFINIGEVTFMDDGRIRAYIKSVDNPPFVEDDKVLGFMHYSEFVLTPHAEGSATHLSVEINSDPKGLIPKWMVNMTQERWPIDFFRGLRGQLTKRGLLKNSDPVAIAH